MIALLVVSMTATFLLYGTACLIADHRKRPWWREAKPKVKRDALDIGRRRFW